MRKWLAVLAVVLTAGALLAPGAEAFGWHLSFYQAKHRTERGEQEYCEQFHPADCTGYGAMCERVSESRVDCIGANWHEDRFGEMECWSKYHWGVRRGGYIKVHIARAHCEYVSE